MLWNKTANQWTATNIQNNSNFIANKNIKISTSKQRWIHATYNYDGMCVKFKIIFRNYIL